MYLLAYDLGNGTNAYGAESYTAAQVGSNPPFKISTSIDPGYVDISSIENWWWFYEHDNNRWIKRDYKFYRNEVVILANFVIGWSNMTSIQKEIAATIFAVGDVERDEIYTIEEQIQHGWVHHRNSIESRHNRITAVQLELFNRLSYIDVVSLFLELKLSGVIDSYTETGMEGTLEGNSDGLFDFVEGSLRTGTIWDGTGTEVGFYDRTYTVKGMTMPELTTRVMDILKRGDY